MLLAGLLLSLSLIESAPDSGAAFGFAVVVTLIILAISVVLHWHIATKCGYPGWYGLGMYIPLVNIILVVVFAFSEWPIERERNLLRRMALRSTPS